jgi:hypothetical protein
MQIEIPEKNFVADIYGYSGIAIAKDYAGTAFRLMDNMWKTVKAKELKNKGINIWVYEPNERVFAGVELHNTPPGDTGLEHKAINLVKYARYKHIGSYKLLQQAGQQMREELTRQGFGTALPYIEIYGHWTNDETKLETDLIMSLT